MENLAVFAILVALAVGCEIFLRRVERQQGSRRLVRR
jgi:hypothetical protein